MTALFANLKTEMIGAIRDVFKQNFATQKCEARPVLSQIAQHCSKVIEAQEGACPAASSQDRDASGVGEAHWSTFDRTRAIPVVTTGMSLSADEVRLNPDEFCLAQL